MRAASDVLVNPAFVRTMAAYNAEMNRRILRRQPTASPTDARRREYAALFSGIAARHAVPSAAGATGNGCPASTVWPSRRAPSPGARKARR